MSTLPTCRCSCRLSSVFGSTPQTTLRREAHYISIIFLFYCYGNHIDSYTHYIKIWLHLWLLVYVSLLSQKLFAKCTVLYLTHRWLSQKSDGKMLIFSLLLRLYSLSSCVAFYLQLLTFVNGWFHPKLNDQVCVSINITNVIGHNTSLLCPILVTNVPVINGTQH